MAETKPRVSPNKASETEEEFSLCCSSEMYPASRVWFSGFIISGIVDEESCNVVQRLPKKPSNTPASLAHVNRSSFVEMANRKVNNEPVDAKTVELVMDV